MPKRYMEAVVLRVNVYVWRNGEDDSLNSEIKTKLNANTRSMITKQLHIAIDSNYLRRDKALNKHEMLYFKELSKLNLVKLHFPYFVYRECISDNIKNIKSRIDKAISELKNL